MRTIVQNIFSTTVRNSLFIGEDNEDKNIWLRRLKSFKRNKKTVRKALITKRLMRFIN